MCGETLTLAWYTLALAPHDLIWSRVLIQEVVGEGLEKVGRNEGEEVEG